MYKCKLTSDVNIHVFLYSALTTYSSYYVYFIFIKCIYIKIVVLDMKIYQIGFDWGSIVQLVQLPPGSPSPGNLFAGSGDNTAAVVGHRTQPGHAAAAFTLHFRYSRKSTKQGSKRNYKLKVTHMKSP